MALLKAASGRAGARWRVPAWLRGRRGRIALTWVGLVIYLGLSAAAFARWGLFTARDWVWIWLLLGLLAASLPDLRSGVRGVIGDWLPFMAMIVAYDLLRGVSDGLMPVAHDRLQIDFDRFVFGGELPTVALQRALNPHPHYHLYWFDYATWAVYTTHFLVTLVVAAVLWRTARASFRRFRTRVVTLAFAAMATFALYPTVPPWLAGKRGAIPDVHRIPIRVAHHVGVEQVGAIFERGSHFANKVAAVPSLHAALPMLLLSFFWSASGLWLRALLSVYVLAMGIALVYSGEHYVFDVLVGWAYAAGTAAAVEAGAHARRRWGELRSAPAPRRGRDGDSIKTGLPQRRPGKRIGISWTWRGSP
jgi:membrane-associated phospholipid phosphatase